MLKIASVLATAMLGIASLTGAAGPATASTGTELHRYRISSDYVSGLSSGADEAVQFQVAYSARFKGLAFFGGGPYDCAQDSYVLAQNACTATVIPDDLPAMYRDTDRWSSQGLIDSTAHLRGLPVYEWHGVYDNTVMAHASDDSAVFLRHYGAHVTYVNNEPSGHGWISPIGSVPCALTLSPYVNNCGIDAEHAMLRKWLGAVRPANTGTPKGRLVTFDQNRYARNGDAAAVGLATTGYEYVPNSCAAGASCKLVLALHGCTQNATDVGTAFVTGTYLNQYADTNHLVVLYPQVLPETSPGTDPLGCWDWWGYLPNDADYAQKSGAQMSAVMAMISANGG